MPLYNPSSSSSTSSAVNSTRAASDNGLKAWTFDPVLAGSVFTPAAGIVTGHELPVRSAQTLSTMWWIVNSQLGAGQGANTFFGLYALLSAGTLTLIGKTADQTSGLQGAGTASATVTVEAGQSLTLDGTKRIWAAVLIGTQGASTLQFRRGITTGPENNVGLTAGTDNLRSWKSGSGLSALPATIAVSGLTTDQSVWFGAS